MALIAVLFVATGWRPHGTTPSKAVPAGKVAYALSIAAGRHSRIGWIEVATLGASKSLPITSRLASSKKIDESPEWSHDGRMVAFLRRGRSRGVYAVSPPRGQPRKIAAVDAKNESSVYPLRWSPRAARLVFDRHGAVECKATDSFDLRFDISRADGRGTKTIHALPRPASLVQMGDIRWSATGRRLLYVVYELDNFADPNECRFHRPGSSLYVIDADGAHRTRLLDREVKTAAWSPDGSRIAYVDCYDADVGCDLYIVRLRGKVRRLLQAEQVASDSELAWSRRGDEILFTGYRGLYAVAVSNGSERTVAAWPESDSNGSFLDFSSAGDVVAVASYTYGSDYFPHRATVHIVRLYGGKVRSILVPAKPGRGRLDGVSVWFP